MKSKPLAAVLAGCLLAANVAAHGDSVPADDRALADARTELRVLKGTEARMREDYETLRARGRLSAAEMDDFQAYLARLGRMVEEQRLTVARLEARHAGAALEPASSASNHLPEDFDRGQTDDERVASLDSRLGASLSDFDDMLLREQQELAEKARATETGSSSSATGRGGSQGSEDSGGEGAASEAEEGQPGVPPEGSAGGEAETSEQSTGEEGGDQSGQQGAEQSTEQPAGEGAEGEDKVASASGVEDTDSRSGRSSVPHDIPDGKDDDIVARQLREAAEKEQDPELREKLWDEYRKYKKRSR